MRKRDHVRVVTEPGRPYDAADQRIQLLSACALAEHFADRERADRDDERRLQDRDLPLQEHAAARNLVRVRPAVAAALRLSGEASRDRGHVDARAKRLLVQSARLLEPTKERLARGPRERPAEAAFAR